MLVAKFLSSYYASAYIKAFQLMTTARLDLLEPIEYSDDRAHSIDADKD
ncbi:MAG: hypothetical protein H7126_05655 [Candidatus Parcubacteria bacterium]|nr:hypothetical protein [Phormidesmis priestleyi]MBC7823350.1 hypothetical protein [Leptolyngbyaceae cyanobacterium LF-bin-113]